MNVIYEQIPYLIIHFTVSACIAATLLYFCERDRKKWHKI